MYTNFRSDSNLGECKSPHCGTCRYFYRMFSDTECRHPYNQTDSNLGKSYPNEGMVCDKWERSLRQVEVSVKASKKFTADVIRGRAELIDRDCGVFTAGEAGIVATMLHQAADLQEREEQEKKYEYSQRRHDEKLGIDVVDMLHCPTIEGSISLHGRFNKNGTIVRREVGDWEVVE